MLSKSDIKKLLEVFATKTDLEELVTRAEFKSTMDSVINKLDAVYGEVKDVRQEQTVHWGQHQDLREDIESVKTRVEKIEQVI